jgi:hypothetical protein
MTASVTFQEVVQAVGRFSQEHPGHTPIILSLENHASDDQQLQMCATLRAVFGDKIVTILPHLPADAFPSLQDTLGKIIIKNSGTFLHYQLITEGSHAPAADSEDSPSE